ncbi:hypothetical protein [Chlorogloeopsis sp. ULAP02]|uniref:hypothetical protein n=1 Tax=Chlorogloeopsis sp. ULAP02 TaxID=3107926 RepID=UPI003135F05B
MIPPLLIVGLKQGRCFSSCNAYTRKTCLFLLGFKPRTKVIIGISPSTYQGIRRTYPSGTASLNGSRFAPTASTALSIAAFFVIHLIEVWLNAST